MLTTLIYRSHISDDVPVKILPDMVSRASKLNETQDVTGILLFNGTHFFQILEGPDEGVQYVYQRICSDVRHHNIVELMQDHAPYRRFGNAGMELFDLREHDKDSVLQAVLDKGTSLYQLTYDDRALQFLRTFVEAREKENYFEVPPVEQWDFIVDEFEEYTPVNSLTKASEHGISFHPILDPFARKVTSIQAIINTASVERIALDPIEHHRLDLALAIKAIRIAGNTLPEDMMLYVNIMPMTLVEIPDAVEQIVAGIADAELVTAQISLAVSEMALISRPDAFVMAVTKLKAAGVSLAIDHFGAGTAGLSLLTRIQPDKIRIDASITRNVHNSGPKQAVVQAILRCCSALEIWVIATGIERAEEWMWLEAAGIINFQGPLFTCDLTHNVAWPELKFTA
ncbi:diguanylate phosphodiesterase [Type-D symbiont of Plautia stali]|uniref:diguanylate phosphodiesterase n=1 Tax=Type-D symbiont of Plautia stali TaxID=1560356 RepID=UPI00073F6FCB|nr:diguanylate phosphodiesterase [Type-D symbiont of Plautia stali]